MPSTRTGSRQLPDLAWGPGRRGDRGLARPVAAVRPVHVGERRSRRLHETLSRPWHRCVRDIVGAEPWSAAAVFAMDGNDDLGSWGDYGTALVVATAATVVVIQVGMWTD